MKRLSLLLFCFFTVSLFGQNPPKADQNTIQYIDKYKAIAISEMERSGVPASITLAQGIRESGNGNSRLAKEANNHFGIKCAKDWTGPTFYQWDDDPDPSCFRSYLSAENSYVDHSEILLRRKNYKNLFTLDPYDYKAWCEGLKKAGYATDPAYPEKLIKTIEQYDLTKYDRMQSQPLPLKEDSIEAEEDIVDLATLRSKKVSPLFLEYKKGIYRKNNASYVYSKRGESPLAVANRFGIPYKKFLKFNDLRDGDELLYFQFAYIEPKKKHYEGVEETYFVNGNETMYEIAQFYAMKLSTLYKLNRLKPGEEPAKGEMIYLKDMAPSKPKLRAFDDVRPDDTRPVPTPDTVRLFKPVKQPREFTPIINSDLPKPVIDPVKPKDPVNPNYKPRPVQGTDYIDTSLDPNASATDRVPGNMPMELPQIDNPDAIPTPSNGGGDGFKPVLTTPTQPTTPPVTTTPPTTTTPPVVTPIKRPDTPTPSTITKPTETSSAVTKHKVAKGETLYGISKKYGVSVDSVKLANQLKDNTLTLGQTLIIPKK